jgi:hypothetical protein
VKRPKKPYLKTKPLSQAEMVERFLVPEGFYRCRICFAGESLSNFSMPMMVLTLELTTEDGEVLGRISDQISGSGEQLRGFCDAFKLLAGDHTADAPSAFDLLNRSAYCEVMIKRSASGPRNEVKRYFASRPLASFP